MHKFTRFEMKQFPPHDVVQCGVTEHGNPLYVTRVLDYHQTRNVKQSLTVQSKENRVDTNANWITCSNCKLKVVTVVKKQPEFHILSILNLCGLKRFFGYGSQKKKYCSRCNNYLGTYEK